MKNGKDSKQKNSTSSGSLSELTNLRRRLLTDEERLRRALDTFEDGVFFADRDGRITHANARAEELLSTPGRTLEGTACTDAFWRITAVNGITSPEQGPALLHRIQNAEPLSDVECVLERLDGSRVAIGVETVPVHDAGKVLAGTLIRIVEVAGARPVAGQGPLGPDPLRVVVGQIANDFNNILTAIIGNIALARTEVSREDDVYKTLTYVEKASMRARDLADRLLSLAASGGGVPAVAPIHDPFKKAAAIHGTGRILVMDDEEMVRHVASRILTYLGYEVAEASDGAEAVALYSEAHAAGRPFRAVIMDLTVQGGMGGEETLAELVKVDPDVKGIVSTGFSSDPIMANYRSHGFQGAVRKPYEITQLSSAVNQVLAGKS